MDGNQKMENTRNKDNVRPSRPPIRSALKGRVATLMLTGALAVACGSEEKPVELPTGTAGGAGAAGAAGSVTTGGASGEAGSVNTGGSGGPQVITPGGAGGEAGAVAAGEAGSTQTGGSAGSEQTGGSAGSEQTGGSAGSGNAAGTGGTEQTGGSSGTSGAAGAGGQLQVGACPGVQEESVQYQRLERDATEQVVVGGYAFDFVERTSLTNAEISVTCAETGNSVLSENVRLAVETSIQLPVNDDNSTITLYLSAIASRYAWVNVTVSVD